MNSWQRGQDWHADLVRNIENGELVPYMSPLVKLSRALGVRLGTFLDDQEHLGPVITKNGDMDGIAKFRGSDSRTAAGRSFFSLARNKTSRHMEPLMMDLYPADDEGLKKIFAMKARNSSMYSTVL